MENLSRRQQSWVRGLTTPLWTSVPLSVKWRVWITGSLRSPSVGLKYRGSPAPSSWPGRSGTPARFSLPPRESPEGGSYREHLGRDGVAGAAEGRIFRRSGSTFPVAAAFAGVGEARGSPEPGGPHLSRGSRATAPPAPTAAAGLSLVPRRSGVLVSGATETGATSCGRRWGKASAGRRGERLGSPARRGSGARRDAGSSSRDLWIRRRRRHEACEHSGGAALTCRFIGRAGTEASPVTSLPRPWVEAAAAPEEVTTLKPRTDGRHHASVQRREPLGGNGN